MKKLLLLIITFCSLTVMGQYPVSSINITMPAQPAANTANWLSGAVPIMITAQANLVQGQVPGQLVESRILVTIKNGGNKICGTYTQQTAPLSNFNKASMTWSGGAALGLLGQECKLPPGNFTLCVQFFSGYAPVVPLSNEVCKSFTIADTKQQSYSPPQNTMPVNGKVFTEQESNLPIMLRWTPVLPKPNADVQYKVRILEILPGQNKTAALKTNTPIDILEVKNQTQASAKLSKRCNNCEYIWNVEASKKSQMGDIEMLGTSEATSFSVKKEDNDPDTSNPPKNVTPAEDKVFSKEEAEQPIRFTWVGVMPKPKEPVLYKVRVVEIKKGQSKTEALRSNAPTDIFEVKNATQTTAKLSKRCNGCEYIWDVTATGTEKVQGGAPRNYGTSDATSFRIIITDPGGCMAIDTTKYTVTCKGIDAQGRYIYQINDLILKNISANPGRTGLFANPATNYIIPNPPTSFSVQNLVPASANPILAGNQISISFEAHSTSTTSLSFFVDGTIPLGATYCDKHIQVDIDQLPSCICNPCKGKTTTFGNIAATPVVTYQNNGSVSVSSTVTHSPEKVIKVSAQIVDVQRLGENGCLRCTKESGEFGNFTGGSFNNSGGSILNGSRGYGKQIQWNMNSATMVNNFNYDLQMMFPPLTEVSCCKDSLKICIRWSFTDEKCVTCDTLICSVITREYKKSSGPIYTPTSMATQISRLGEPYVSWLNQANDDLPRNFEDQAKTLYARLKGKEISFAQYLEIAKEDFTNIRMGKKNIGATRATLSTATMCGNGTFENGQIDLSEWNGASTTLSGNNYTYNAWSTLGLEPANGLPLNSNINSASTHQTIVDQGTDPNEPTLLLNRVPNSPSGNLYAVRLGNSVSGCGAEKIEKTFTVPSSGNVLTFWYAAVFQDPGTTHTNIERPSFHVNVYNASGAAISGLVFLDPLTPTTPKDIIFADANNPFFVPHIIGPNNVRVVRDWTCAKIDLSSLAGQTARVEFVNTDCSQCGHWGYTYLDNFCLGCAGSPSGSVSINAISDSCIKPGLQVCVDYTLPRIGTNVGSGTISLKVYHSGSPTAYILTSPLLTTASGTYCFTVSPSQLPCSNGQIGYDIVATGNFSITPVGGSPTPITVTSPDPVGNFQGIKPGFNNDLVCCTTLADDCCKDFVKRVTAQVSMVGNTTTGYNTIKFVPTFTAGPRLIKQVRISIVNMESSSTNKECLTCETNTGSYGTMSVPQSLTGGGKDPIEGMTYPTNPLYATCLGCPPVWNSGRLTHEVIWGSNAGPGYNLMDGAGDQSTTFNVHLPRRSTLSCCDDTIKVCIKYSFTDVDCKTCDTIICYKVVNRNTISLLSSLSPIYLPGKRQDNGDPNSDKGELMGNSMLAVMAGIKKDKN